MFAGNLFRLAFGKGAFLRARYPGTPFTWTYLVAIVADTPRVSLGAAASYAWSGAGVSGVLVNAGTGELTGTPDTEEYGGVAMVEATDAKGRTYRTRIYFDVKRAPVIDYGDPFAWTIAVPIAPEDPVSTGGQITGYSIVAGSLTAGLSLNAATGRISGTPTALEAAGSVTIRATGPGGTGDTVVLYTVGP